MNKYGHLSSKGQITTTKVRITALFIFVLTILAALIVYPKSPGWFSNFKVHLGLDLQGGTHLIYQADISDLGDVNIEDSISALRDVIERRVNNYGVSEPVVQTNYSGDNYRIIVELAGVTDIKEAISIIDKTPLLDFRIQEEVSNDSENQINEIKQEAQAVLERALAGEDFAALAKEYSQDPGSAE